MNYIKIFQDAQALSVSVGNTYTEDQLMHIFMDNIRQGEKYSAQIDNHQVEFRREGNFTDAKYLFISSLHTDHINLDSSSGCGKNSARENIVQTKCTFCGGVNHFAEKFKRIRKEKEKSCADDDSDNRCTERTPRKCFRCRSEDNIIAKCPKTPKYN